MCQQMCERDNSVAGGIQSPLWEIKGIRAAQDVESEVILAHRGQGCRPEGPPHSSLPPTARAHVSLSKTSEKNREIRSSKVVLDDDDDVCCPSY